MTQVGSDIVTQAIESWSAMTATEHFRTFRSLKRDERERLVLGLTAWEQAETLLLMPVHERFTCARVLPPDDAADLIQEGPEQERASLLDLLDPVARAEVGALLAYAEDDAGGLMNPRFARLRPEMTVDEAISYLRLQGRNMETIYSAYVLDVEQRPLGVVSLRDLFTASGRARIADVMNTRVVAVSAHTDQEEVARLFAAEDLTAMPVLDDSGRMRGIVTVDDIVDVVQEEATKDIYQIGGMEALDEPCLEIGFWQMVRKRAGWLAALFLGEMLTATATGHHEEEIAKAVVLALFIPLIISSGGNSGSQATTLVIRAMALTEVRPRDRWRVARREILSGLVLGGVLASVGFLRIMAWQAVGHSYSDHALQIATTVALSLVGVVLFGTVAGLDPATASAPFVAPLVDVTGLVIYFSVAQVILKGTLL